MSKKPSQSLAVELDRFVAPFRIDGSREFHLKSHNTVEKGGLDKDRGERIIEANRKRLSDFQEKLYAQDRWSLLLIFQGMDAAGKDSAIKAFMQEPPFSGRKPVFVGDDLTDQDAFKAVEDLGGISVAVGDRVHAQYRVQNPAAVRAWLREIAALQDSHRA